MDKFEFYKRALAEGKTWQDVDWIVSVFCVTQGKPEGQPKAWELRFSPTQALSFDAEGNEIVIDGWEPGKPLLRVREGLMVGPQDIPNVKEEIYTSCGLLLANWVHLAGIFGDRFNYINRRFGVSDVEKLLSPLIADDPEEGQELDPRLIPCSLYLQWTQQSFDLSSISQVVQVGASEKTLTSPPGLDDFVEKLLKEYEGKLEDPAVIAEMQSKVLEFDRAWRAGDSGNDFLIGKKSEKIVRMKRNLMYGGEAGADGNATRMKLIAKPLNSGWDTGSFVNMQNTSRMGSYSRGAETMIGGVEVKWLIRASSNLTMAEDNCDTQAGVTELVDKSWVKSFIGFTIMDKGQEVVVTEDNVGSYLGKHVVRRSPMYCKLGKTDFCRVCLGPRLSGAPKELSQSIVAIGSAIMLTSMGAMHGRVLETVDYDILEQVF